ncbi:MAG: DUF4397 domain-containing protein [Terriglobales bacterium]
MSRLLKALPLALAIVAVAALSIIAASCNSGNTQARFVNAISDADALDFYFNGTKISSFSDLQPNTVSSSSYTGVPAGSVQIQGFQTGTTNSAFPVDVVSLNSGSYYTLVAAGLSKGTVNILNLLDNNTAPANSFVNFRVINASTYGPTGSGGAVDVYILPEPNPCSPGIAGCTATIPNVASQTTSGYKMLPYNSEGNGWLLVVTEAPGSSIQWINQPLNGVGSATEGAICTLVLYDQAGGTHMSTTQTSKLNDLNCSGL